MAVLSPGVSVCLVLENLQRLGLREFENAEQGGGRSRGRGRTGCKHQEFASYLPQVSFPLSLMLFSPQA